MLRCPSTRRDLFLVQFHGVEHTKEEEEDAAAERDLSYGDLAGEEPAAEDGERGAETVADDGADDDPPVVTAGGHGYGRYLAPVAPLAEEGQGEGLHEGRGEDEHEEVLDAIGGSLDNPRGLSEILVVGRGDGPRAIRGSWPGQAAFLRSLEWVITCGVGELVLDLCHLLLDGSAVVHEVGLAAHLGAENEEETAGGELGKPLGQELRHGVAEEGTEDGHDEEGCECGREDYEPVVPHSHEGGDEEGLVAQLGDDDHGETGKEGLAAELGSTVDNRGEGRDEVPWLRRHIRDRLCKILKG